jgi:Arc/MetJ family transcription regulator
MRTNVHIDDDLLDEARRLSGVRSKKAVIEQALRVFVESKSAEHRRESYRRRVAAIEEKTRRLRFSNSAVELIRKDRERG